MGWFSKKNTEQKNPAEYDIKLGGEALRSSRGLAKPVIRKKFKLDLLIAVGIIVAMVGLILVITKPEAQFARARNSQRVVSLNYLLNSIEQNLVDNRGGINLTQCPADEIPNDPKFVRKNRGLDLCACLVPDYLTSLPFDPETGYFNSCDDYDTGFAIYQNAETDRLQGEAPGAELGIEIVLTR
jgi:hypothetical protein